MVNKIVFARNRFEHTTYVSISGCTSREAHFITFNHPLMVSVHSPHMRVLIGFSVAVYTEAHASRV